MKNLKYISILTASLALFSCDVDDDKPESGLPGSAPATNITVNPTLVSFFDQAAIDYDLFVSIGVVDEVDVALGNSFKNVSITDKVGVFTADFNDLGVSVIGDSDIIQLSPSASGVLLEELTAVIEVVNPITVSTPEVVTQTRVADTLFTYEIETTQNSLADVTVESKTFFDGVYAEVFTGRTAQVDTVLFNTSSFNKLDTVYYRVTATTIDGLVASKESKVFLDSEFFENSVTGNLSASDQYYTLPDLSATEEETAIIEFVNDDDFVFDSLINAATANATVTFVEYTDATTETFDFADKLEAISVYNSGIAITSISVGEIGQVFIYRIETMDDDGEAVFSYGLFRIDSINTEVENNLSISVKS